MAASTASSRTSTRSAGKAGESLREHLDGCCATAASTSSSATCEVGVELERPGPPLLGPRGGARGLRRAGVPGAARPALRDLRGARAGGRGRVRGRRAGAGHGRGHRLAGAARPQGGPHGVHVLGRWGRGTGDARAWRWPPPTGAAGSYVDLADSTSEAEAALASGWPTRATQGDARRARARTPWRRAAGGLRGLQRHGAGGLPRAPDQRSYDLADLACGTAAGPARGRRPTPGRGCSTSASRRRWRTRRW
jgi:hypothetical protein